MRRIIRVYARVAPSRARRRITPVARSMRYASVPDGVVPSSPAFSALVVDANSGRTLYSADENGLRHPASITKVMTLYLLFEKLDSGAMTLQTPNPDLRARRGAGALETRPLCPATRSASTTRSRRS